MHSLFKKGDLARLRGHLREPTPDRLWYIADAFRNNMSLEEIHQESRVDPWFLAQIEELVALERSISDKKLSDVDATTLRLLKKRGFADAYLAKIWLCTEEQVRSRRKELGILPVYKRIDSCAGEFPSDTAYMYSCYETRCEARPDTDKKK